MDGTILLIKNNLPKVRNDLNSNWFPLYASNCGIYFLRKYQNMFQCVWSLSENGKEPSIKWKIVKMVSTIKQKSSLLILNALGDDRQNVSKIQNIKILSPAYLIRI